MTTNTLQGLELLEGAISEINRHEKIVGVSAAYFPFDQPSLMEKAVQIVQPHAMVLLESEMWPGLMAALKKYGCKTLIINGRMRAKSLTRYRWWPSLWRSIRPYKILAISEDDARRFMALFGNDGVEVMPNIKFDRFESHKDKSVEENPLVKFIPNNTAFVVLGSVRRQEEPRIEKLIAGVHKKKPDTIIGLFPRHMQRIKYWQDVLSRLGLPWELRSRLKTRVVAGTVVLWDTFGELSRAYALADAAFVGGSLAPLGGQNFLEPLSHGVVPVIGPSWENFAWVGADIIKEGLLRVAADWKKAADLLLADLESSSNRETVRAAADRYIQSRQGGTARAARLIEKTLSGA
jgi:3-deoxy-D-manno-octulosonic-acid transferase